LDPEIEDESEEKRIQFTQNQRYLEGLRSWTKSRSKTRDLSPWYCHRSAVIATDLRHYGGSTCRFSTRGLLSPSRWFFRL